MSDLFDKIDALFRKEEVESPPSAFMLHRFLASDLTYAQVAKEIALHNRDDARAFRLWQNIVPKQSRSPYLSYIAPGSPGDPHPLVERLMEVELMNRDEAEEALDLLRAADRVDEIAVAYGVDLSDWDDDDAE